MRSNIIIGFFCLLIGAIGGSQLFPRIKTQEVVTEKEVVRKDIVTVVKEVVRADGSKETITTTTDKSKENKQTQQTKTTLKTDWHISTGAKIDKTYELHVERRIVGDIYLGGSVDTSGKVGLTLGIDF